MKYKVVNHLLKELLEAHGLQCSEGKGWVIPNGEFPLISMTWYPKPEQNSGVLQVDVQLDKNQRIEECFGAFGAGDEGLKDAIQNFSVNSLHTMLAAFWKVDGLGQVETEEWNINGEK